VHVRKFHGAALNMPLGHQQPQPTLAAQVAADGQEALPDELRDEGRREVEGPAEVGLERVLETLADEALKVTPVPDERAAGAEARLLLHDKLR
jgi:hypothetical protein